MCRDKAIQKLNFIQSQSLRDRAQLLLGKPELLNQGVFGICSSMVVLHVVMVHAPDQFVDYMTDSVFGRHAFLIYRLLDYYATKSALELSDRVGYFENYLKGLGRITKKSETKLKALAQHVAYQDGHALDYVIGRTLIEIMYTDLRVGRPLYEDSQAWSLQYFKGPRWDIVQGDFALKTAGVQYLFQHVFQIATQIVGGASFEDKVNAINSQFDAAPRCFVVVAINGFSDLASAARDGEVVEDAFHRAPLTAEYTHWVAFTQKIEILGPCYVFHFFSWGEIYSVEIKKDVAGSYMVDLVYGHL